MISLRIWRQLVSLLTIFSYLYMTCLPCYASSLITELGDQDPPTYKVKIAPINNRSGGQSISGHSSFQEEFKEPWLEPEVSLEVLNGKNKSAITLLKTLKLSYFIDPKQLETNKRLVVDSYELPGLGELWVGPDGSINIVGQTNPAPHCLELVTASPVIVKSLFIPTLKLTAPSAVIVGNASLENLQFNPMANAQKPAQFTIAEQGHLIVSDIEIKNGQLLNQGQMTLKAKSKIRSFINEGLFQGSGQLHVKEGENRGVMEDDTLRLRVDRTFSNRGHADLSQIRGKGEFLNYGTLGASDRFLTLGVRDFQNKGSKGSSEKGNIQAKEIRLTGSNNIFLNEEEGEVAVEVLTADATANSESIGIQKIINRGTTLVGSLVQGGQRLIENLGTLKTKVLTQATFVNRFEGSAEIKERVSLEEGSINEGSLTLDGKHLWLFTSNRTEENHTLIIPSSFKNPGTIDCPGGVIYDLPLPIENVTTNQEISFTPQHQLSLESLKDLRFKGKLKLMFPELKVAEEITLPGIDHLHLVVEKNMHVVKGLIAPQITADIGGILSVGDSNAQLGKLESKTGPLTLTAGTLQLQFAKLFGQGPTTLIGKERITIGSHQVAQHDFKKHLGVGYFCTLPWAGWAPLVLPSGAYNVSYNIPPNLLSIKILEIAKAPIYELNGTFVSTNSTLTIQAPVIDILYGNIWSKDKAFFKADQRLTFYRVVAEGENDLECQAPHIQVTRAPLDNTRVFLNLDGLPSGTVAAVKKAQSTGKGLRIPPYTPYAPSDASYLNYLCNIDLKTSRLELCASHIWAGPKGSISLNGQECNEKNSAYVATSLSLGPGMNFFPSCLAGDKLTVSFGKTEAALTAHARRATFGGQNAGFYGTGDAVAPALPKGSVTIDLHKLIASEAQQQRGLLRYHPSGEIEPVIPMGYSVTPSPEHLLFWGSAPQGPVINPLACLPMNLWIQKGLATHATKTYLKSCAGFDLWGELLQNATELKEKTGKEIISAEDLKKGQEKALIYWILQQTGQVMQMRPHLFIPAHERNTNKGISATESVSFNYTKSLGFNKAHVDGGKETNITSGPLTNLSSVIEADKTTANSESIYAETLVNRQVHSRGYRDTLDQKATFRARTKSLEMNADNSIYTKAARLEATQGKVKLTTGGNTILDTQNIETDHSERGKRYHFHQHTQTHIPTEVIGKEGIESVSGGKAVLPATYFKGKNALIEAQQGVEAPEVRDTVTTESSYHKKGGAFKSSKTITTNSATQISKGVRFDIDEELKFLTTQGNLTFVNPTFQVPHTIMEAMPGVVKILQGTSFHISSTVKNKSDIFWQKSKTKSETHQYKIAPAIPGSIEIHSRETIVQQVRGHTLEFLPRIQQHGGSVIPEIIQEVHEKHSKTKQGPTAALALFISLAITVLTQGMGASLLGLGEAAAAVGAEVATTAAVTTTASTLTQVGSAMASASFTSLCTQATLALMNNEGNLSKALKDLASSESLRTFATAVGSAGITEGALSELEIPTTSQVLKQADGKTLSLEGIKQITQAQGIENTVRGGLNVALQGEKLGRAAKDAGIGTATGVGGAIGAYHIGNLRTPGVVGSTTVGHFGLGAGLAIAQGKNPIVGGIAAASTETLMEVLPWKPETNAAVAQVVTAGGALLTNQDPGIAFSVAKNAVENNGLMHPSFNYEDEQEFVENLQLGDEHLEKDLKRAGKFLTTDVTPLFEARQITENEINSQRQNINKELRRSDLKWFQRSALIHQLSRLDEAQANLGAMPTNRLEVGVACVGMTGNVGPVVKNIGPVIKTAFTTRKVTKEITKATHLGKNVTNEVSVAINANKAVKHPHKVISKPTPAVNAVFSQTAAQSPESVTLNSLDLAGINLNPLMGEYRIVKGHHVHAKKAFEGHPYYDPQKGFCISNQLMKNLGIDHQKVTTYQMKLFRELAASGRPNTLEEHTRIAVESLLVGGKDRLSVEQARQIVAQSLWDLKKSNVRAPTNIPWKK